MPPRNAAGEDVGARSLFLDDLNRVLIEFKDFFEQHRPPLDHATYDGLVPNNNPRPHWTAQDEAALEALPEFASIPARFAQVWANKGAKLLWRVFPLVYRAIPTELFSWANQLDVSTSNNLRVEGGQYNGAPNLVWSNRFCDELVLFTMHGFWTYESRWDFPIMVLLLQLAVICRTNDCRTWHVVNHTEDMFFTELGNEVQAGAGRTIKQIMDAVEARMDGMGRRPSQFRLLCQEIVKESFNEDASPLRTGAPGPYKVTHKDLTSLVKILDGLGPSPDRAGKLNGPSTKTWKFIINGSNGSGNSHHPLQPVSGFQLAKAIQRGLMAMKRDEMIAARVAQAVAAPAAQAVAQPVTAAAPSQPSEEAQGSLGHTSNDDPDRMSDDDESFAGFDDPVGGLEDNEVVDQTASEPSRDKDPVPEKEPFRLLLTPAELSEVYKSIRENEERLAVLDSYKQLDPHLGQKKYPRELKPYSQAALEAESAAAHAAALAAPPPVYEEGDIDAEGNINTYRDDDTFWGRRLPPRTD